MPGRGEPTPANILDIAFQRASRASTGLEPIIINQDIVERVEYVCRFLRNRAGVRLVPACLLAKAYNPSVDIRKSYTAIGGVDSYSGRTYDESYIEPFVILHNLPCNPTTAFLTPALRNRNIVLTPDVNLVGNSPMLYQAVLQLLTDVYEAKVSAEDLLAETLRWLIKIRDERQLRMETLLADLRTSEDALPLSSEAIVGLIDQHLKCKGSSRLPVLIVAAAYQAASEYLGKKVLPLESHNAADKQTGSSGDIQIVLENEDHVVTVYEMKAREVRQGDIDHAVIKIEEDIKQRIDNYIFITTEEISQQVKDYAFSMYERTGGIEFVVLDCLNFLRHFLHLFHRLRQKYLDAYQELLLAEPESAVSQSLKEAFLALRQNAESAN